MEMRIVSLLLCCPLIACASQIKYSKESISEVYVKDFYSSELTACKASDVNLTHAEAEKFFKRSKSLDYKTMTDNYSIAPCYIMGTLKYKNEICDWKIFAGATGSITCKNHEWYFACDTCNGLFEK